MDESVQRESDDYFSSSIELQPSDFHDMNTYKLKDTSCAIVLFYAPWCPHCKNLQDVWKKLSKKLMYINVKSLNCEKYKQLVDKIKTDMPSLIQGYPTIMLYKNGEPQEKYQGERTLSDLTSKTMSFCQ